MSNAPQRAETNLEFVEFLAEQQMTLDSDADLQELMDSIADTLGDMFGFQSDRHAAVERFVGRLTGAADAAAATLTMSKN